MPIVEPNPDDSHEVIVLGFAAFELLKYVRNGNDHSIQASFIQTVMPGEMGDETAEYGTYASRLIL